MKKFNFFEKLWEHGRTLRRVGLVLVLCLFTITQVWADTQFDEVAIVYSLDGGSTTHKYTCNWSYGDFTNYAVVTSSLVIKEVYYKYRRYNGNVCDAQLFWNNGEDHYDGIKTWYHNDNCWSYGDEGNVGYQLENDAFNVTLARSTDPSGEHTIYYYWQMWGSLATSDGCSHNWYMPNNTTKQALHYKILPPNVSDFTVTPSGDIISGTGTSDDPFIISYKGSLTLTSSVGTQAHPDANSTIQFSKDNSSWGTASSNKEKTVSSITTTDKTSVDVYARYYNSASCIGAVKTKTYYYKTSPWAVAGDMNSSAWNTNTYCFGHFGRNASGKDTSYVDIELPANTDINFKIKNRTNDNWWTYSGNASTKNMDYATDNKVARQFNQNNSYGNTVLKTAGAGTYRFILNTTDANKITVVFPTSYKVTYHNNGYSTGDVPTDDLYYADGTTVTAKDNTGKLIASESGKVFAGWNTASDGSGTYVDPADTENNTFTISSTAHDLYPVWKDGYYLITPGGTSFNLTPSAPFTTGRSIGSGSAVSVNGISSAYWWTISGSSSACNVYNVVYDKDRHLLYDTQTDDEDIYVYVRGTGNLHYAIYKDGEAYTAAASDTVAIGAEKVFHFSIQHSLKSRLVLSANSTSPKITNIRVVKNGSALAAPCTAGYQLSFPGRAGVTQNTNYTIDGITLNTKADMKFGTGSMKLNSTSNYIQFTTASAIQLQVKISANQQFYVCTNKSSAAATGSLYGGTSGQTYNINLGSANTYYIVGNGSDITIDKIAFAAASCSTPTSPSISGTTAYNAGDNIELTASATGTISGTTTYQWYKGDPENDGVSQGDASTSGATLTINSCVTGDAGTYYCVISNGDGCTVTTYQAITVSCLTAPVAVTSLTNSVHTTNSLTYTWTKASNASGYTATLYSDEDCTVSVEAKALGDVATATFTGLTPNVTYYCKVQSKGNGTVYCEDGGTTSKVSGTTDAPSAPTFSPASGSTVSGSQTITITGHSGSTVYYKWETSAQDADDIYNSGSGSHGTANAGTASITVQSGKTLYAISRLSGVNSSVSSASYTVDATAPTLSSSDPDNGDTGINTSGTIVLTFSEALSAVDDTKFTLTNATKGDVAIDGSDNTKVNIAYSGASYSTTVTLATAAGAVADAVGNTSAALSISFTTKAEPSCSGDPSALANKKLYKVEDMASACADDLSESGQYKYGLSSNGKFYVVGTTNNNDGSTGTVEMKTDVSLSNVGGDTDADFTNSAWLKMEGSTSHHSIKFVIPTGGGKLYVYGKGGGSDSGKGNVQIKENSTSTVTEVIAKTSSSACKSSAISVNAGTYYIYSSGKSAALYGIYFDKAPELSSADPANGDTDVPVSGTIVLTFDESISSVTAAKFSLSTGSISAVAVDGTDDTKVNITYSGLPGSTEVTLSVAAGAVTDAAGNTSAALSDITFTTVATGYAITNANPDNGAIAITSDGSSAITESEAGETVYITATPSPGYHFSSWDVYKTDASGTKVVLDDEDDHGSFKMPSYAVTVDAAFAINSHTLTWDFDGGETSATEGTNYTAGGSVNYNTALTYPADNTMSKDGYDFNGWSSKPAKMPDDNLTITAQWAKLYRVDYNVMGGDALDPAYEMGSSVTTIDLPTPERSGYTFEGWYTTAGDLVDDDPYTPTADITLYAKWQGAACAGGGGSTTLISITPTITNDNKNNSSASASGTPGGTAYWDKMGTTSPYKLNSDGAYFALKLSSGYYQATDVLVINGADGAHLVYYGSHGSGTYLGTTGSPSSGTINFTLTGLPSSVDEIYVYRTSDTYNKKLSSISVTRPGSTCYTVTYHGNGATGGYVSDPAQYESGTTVYVYDAAGSYTRTGYEFNGWNTKADGSGTKLSSFTITRDTTLYAQWRIVINADNTDFEGKDTPTTYKDVKVTNGATLTITNATTMRDVTVTGGATLKIQKGTTVHDITVETGSTLNIAKDGESGVTLAANSLALKGGWDEDKENYDMPRVYIDQASTFTRTESVINFDISVDYYNYYPFALPFDVTINDEENVVDYAESYIAAASTYGMHYAIREYDGEQRAEGKAAWKYVPDGTTLKAGKGYIIYAKTVGGKGIIRFPLNMPSAWTTLGEQGSYSAVTKNVVPVTAWGWDEEANDWKEGVPDSRKGWNLLGVPFMSCFDASDASHEKDNAYIKGKLDFSTNEYDAEDDNIYVTVPVHDFSEYIQSPIDEAVLLPGWCFFIQVAKSGELTFAQVGQEDDDNLPIYAPKREQENMPTLKTGIILTGNGAKDKTTFLVSDKYSASEYEFNADLEKMFGENSFTLATYSLSGETRLAYNALSNADAANIIPIGYRAPADGEYTFSVNPRYAESEAFEHVNLIDYETGIMTDLLMGSYTFSTERTQLDTRFALNVVPRQETPTDIETVGGEGINDANGPRKVLINDKMYIIVDGKMYDATGKAVK